MTPPRRFLAAGLAVSAVLAATAAWVASSRPDGLEKVAELLGFGDRAAPGAAGAPMPDYVLPSLGDSPWSGALAGVAGVLAAFAAAWAVGRLLARRKHAP